MKFFRNAVWLMCALLCAAVPAESAARIGFVDVDRAFEAYDRTAGITAGVQKIKEEGRVQRSRIEEEINRMNAELRERLSSLPGEEIDRRRENIQQKVRELWEFDRAQKNRESAPVHSALGKIYEAVESFAEAGDYDIILEKRVSLFGRTVLYGKKSLDVTDEIIKILTK